MASNFRRLLGLAMGGVLLWVMTACSPLKMLNALTPDGSFDKTEGIAYGDDPRQKLDVYVPRHPMENAPVVVFFYGGSWNSGSRSDYGFVGEALASRGIVAVLADYRLYPQVRYPQFLRGQRESRGLDARTHSASSPVIRSACICWATVPAPTTPRCWRWTLACSAPSACRRTIIKRLDRSGRALRFSADQKPGRTPGVFLARFPAAVAADQPRQSRRAAGLADGGNGR